MNDNVFTNKLLEVILPPDVVKPKQSINQIKGKAVKFESLNLHNMTHVFLILEKSDRDLKSLMELKPNINEEHVIVMLYNILCSLKFIHSTGVIHRDLKPSNILVDCDSRIQICDFGLSRCMPKNSDVANQLKEAKKNPMIHSSNAKERSQFKDTMRHILKKTRAEREQKEREMSPCIQTRWYRAPEIILTDRTYNESIDIWSAGLVLGELMRCTEKFRQHTEESSIKKSILFKGKACFPISPADDDGSVYENDQIFKILERYPDIKVKNDFSFVTHEETMDYVKSILCRKEKE